MRPGRVLQTYGKVLSIVAVAATSLVCGAGTAAAKSSPGFTPDPGLNKVSAKPLPLISIGTGKDPNLLVDPAGTAHVVFTEDGGASSPDTLAVCNLLRGRKSCAQNSTAPTPQAPPGGQDDGFEGNYPGGNHDTDGAVPLAIENQLYVVERRFPDTFPTPDGSTSDSNVFEWQSIDGGATLTGPADIGDNQMAGGAITYGDPGAPSIGTISRDQTEGTFFQGTSPGSYAGDVKAQLGSAGQAFDGSVAPDMSGGVIRPVAAFDDENGHVFLREWSGQGDVNDVSTWTPAQVLSGYSPQIVGGPSGVFLLMSSSDINGGTLSLRKIVAGAVSGPVKTLGKSLSPPALSEDAAGELSYAFTDATGVEDETSSDGSSFSPAQLVSDIPSGMEISHLVTAAAADGGGFVTYVENPQGAEAVGTVVAGAFGTQADTRIPGLGSTPGGGVGSSGGDQLASSTCSASKFGDVDAEIYPQESACFVPDPVDRNMSVTLGTVDLNGLLLIPDPGTRIGIDAKLHKIQTSGSVRVVLRAHGIPDITLYHGPLSYDVPQDGYNGELFDPYFDGTGIKIAGFPIDGSIDPKLTKGGVSIPISLKLPPYLGGITGSVTLTAKSFQGLSLDSLNFNVPEIDLGALAIDKLMVKYQSNGDVWAGGAQLLVPEGGSLFTLQLNVEFDNGEFTKGHVDFGLPYPGIPLGDEDPVSLYFTHGFLDLNFQHGVTLTGGVGFGAYPLPVSENPGPQDFLFSIEAALKASFGNPVTLTMTGTTYLSKLQIGQEVLTWQAPDNISFAGSAGINLGPVNVTGEIGGQIEPTHHQYGAYYDATGSILSFVKVHVGIAINQNGFGAELPVGGIVCYWSTGCHAIFFGDAVSPFKNPPLSTGPAVRDAHTAALASFTVPAGAPSADVSVTGTGGPPGIILVEPNGQQVTPTVLTQDALPSGANAVAIIDTADDATDLGLDHPQAGTWRVMQAPDSTYPIAGLQYAFGERSPSARATVSGSGYKRVLHYHVSTSADTAVTFVEQTSRLTHVIGTAKGRSGSIAFTPVTGPAGRRKIVAELTNNGAPLADHQVATYAAPGPLKPGRAGRLRVTASNRGFTYSYTPPANAAHVLIKIDATDGRHLERLVSARTRRGTVPLLGKGDATTVTVTVTGIGAAGTRGPAVSAHAHHSVSLPKPKKRRSR
jgi:hypothetical protein